MFSVERMPRNVAAGKEVLERTIGKPVEHDFLERLEALERAFKLEKRL